jgi:hypothetical protein
MMQKVKGGERHAKKLARSFALPALAGLLALGSAGSCEAATTYFYTGNAYNDCGGIYCTGGPYHLDFTFTTSLSGAALDNLAFQDISGTITAFKASDGTGLVVNQNTPGSSEEIEIATNATGGIVDWFAGAYANSSNTQLQTNWNSPFGFIPGADFSETTADFAGDFGFISNDPGKWTATPEPATWIMMLVGFGGLGFAAYRRSARMTLAARGA